MLDNANVDISTKQQKKVKSIYTCPEYENSMPEMSNSNLIREEMRREMEMAMVAVAQLQKALDASDVLCEL